MLFDIIAALIFLLAIFTGKRRGFVKAILKLASLIISIVVAFYGKTFIAEKIMNWHFVDSIRTFLTDNAQKIFGDLQNIPVIADGVGDQIENLTFIIVQILVFIVIFIVCSIVLGVLAGVITDLLRTIKLGWVNSILGSALGAINGYIIVYILTLIALAGSAFSPFVAKSITNSYIYNNIPTPIQIINFVKK